MIQKLIGQIVVKPGHSDNSYSVELLQIIQFESKTKSIQILATKWIELTTTKKLKKTNKQKSSKTHKNKTWNLKPSGSVDKLTQYTLFINWLSHPMNLGSSLQPLFLVSVAPEAQYPEIAALASSSLIHRQAESFTIHADSITKLRSPLTPIPTVFSSL